MAHLFWSIALAVFLAMARCTRGVMSYQLCAVGMDLLEHQKYTLIIVCSIYRSVSRIEVSFATLWDEIDVFAAFGIFLCLTLPISILFYQETGNIRATQTALSTSLFRIVESKRRLLSDLAHGAIQKVHLLSGSLSTLVSIFSHTANNLVSTRSSPKLERPSKLHDKASESGRQQRTPIGTSRDRITTSGELISAMISPVLRSAKGLFCLIFLASVLIAARVAEAYSPQHLSSWIDEVAKGGPNDVFSWHSFLLLVIMEIVKTSAFQDTAKSLAYLPIRQSSWRIVGPQAFRHVMDLSKDFHEERDTMALIDTIWRGDDLHDLLYFFCFDFLPMVFDGFAALYFISQTLGPCAIAFVTAVGVSNLCLSSRLIILTAGNQTRYNDQFTVHKTTSNNVLRNWRTVVVSNGQEHEENNFAQHLQKTQEAEAHFFHSYFSSLGAQDGVMAVARVLVFSLKIYHIQTHQARASDLFSLTVYWRTLERPFNNLRKAVKKFAEWKANSRELLRLMQVIPTITDASDAGDIGSGPGALTFESVSSKQPDGRYVLHNLSFDVPAGSIVAIVGDSGAGKSSILDLVCRFQDPDEGSVRIDGIDIAKVKQSSLRERIALVSQRPEFLNRSIKENLTYPDRDVSFDKVREACRKVDVDRAINRMPRDYQTCINESGSNLSGGELQRIAIAREIAKITDLRNILLLDEVTSDLDPKAQRIVATALKGLKVTTLVVSHRLESTQGADMILYLREGRIAEHGTHSDLLSRKGGLYKAQWEAAFGT